MIPTTAALRNLQAARIAAARRAAGLSLRAVADGLGVSHVAVRQWETGHASPRQHLQVALAARLGVRWSDLFNLDTHETEH